MRLHALAPLAAGMLLGLLAGPALGESSNPTVVSGSANIQQDGAGNMTVNTGSNRTIINWGSFGVPGGTTTQFNQPGAHAAVLNRVTGSLPSRIDGALLSNGRVYLINPHGVVVGASGVIHTAGFVASTLDVPDAQFLAGGTMNFSGTSNAAIVNLGRIEASDGNVFLVAASVVNEGTIAAPNGAAGLIAGRDVLLTGDYQIFIQPVDDWIGGTGVENKGVIEAARAELVAQGNLYAMAINNSGTVNATTAVEEGGRVILRADGGTVENSGDLIAKTVDKDGKTTGGEIQVLGETVVLDGSARLDASGDLGGGQVNVGGNYQGNGPLPNAQRVWVGSGVYLVADALQVGDGGNVIVWSDTATYFYGQIEARGGAGGGDGGFAEVSGKSYLRYRGDADLRAAHGEMGTLLLDPTNVTFKNGIADGHDTDALTTNFSGFDGSEPADSDIYESELEGMALTAAVVVSAPGNITMEDLTDNVLGLLLAGASGGSLTIQADSDNNGSGAFVMQGANDVIRTEGANISITGASLTISAIDTTGALGTVTGGQITLGITTGAGTVTLNGNLTAIDATVNVNGPAVIGAATTTISSGTGNVSFAGAVDGAAAGTQTLVINSNGTTTFSGAVGAGTTLAALTTNTGGTTNLNGGSVDTSGAVTFNDNVTLGADTVITSVAATFGGTITNAAARSLTVNAGAGALSFSGNIGAGTALGALSANSTVATTFGGMIDAASLTTNAGGTTNLNGGSLTLSGAATFNDNVALGANTTINSVGASFAGTVTNSAARTLTVNAGTGALSFSGNIGSGTALGALAANSTNTTTFGGTVAAASVSTNAGGTTALNGASVTTTGTITFNDDVTLGASTTFNSGGSKITFGGTLGGAFSPSLTAGAGGIQFDGAVTLTGITLSASGGVLTLNNSISVDGTNLDFTGVGSVSVGGTVVLDTDTSAAGGVGAVNFDGVDITGSGSLSIDTTNAGAGAGGQIDLDGVDLTGGSGGLSVSGGLLNLDENISTNGGAVNLSGVTTIVINNDLTIDTHTSAAAAGDVNLGLAAVVLRANGPNDDLTINATGGTAGTVTIGTATTANLLNSLTVSGGTISLNGSITTATTISLTGSVGLDATPITLTSGGGAGEDITITGTVNGTSALTLNAGGSGDVSISGAVGGSTSLTSINATGALLSLRAVTTTGAQTYSAATSLTLNGNLTSTGAGAIGITGPTILAGDTQISTAGAAGDNVTFSSTINGNGGNDDDLTINAGGAGNVTVSGIIGGTAALSSLTVDGNNISLNNIGTSGAAGVANLTDIDAANQLTLAGDVYNTNQAAYEAAAGNNILLTDAAGTVDFISSNDSISFNVGTILLSNGSNLAVNSGDGAISIVGIRGNSDETVNLDAGAGTVAVGAIGSGTEIGAVTITGNGGVTLNGNLTTTGNISVTGQTTLGLDIVISTTNDSVTFNDNVRGNQTLTINAGSGGVNFASTVGSGTALGDLTVNSTGTTQFQGTVNAASVTTNAGGTTQLSGNVTTTGATGIVFGDGVTLMGGAVTITLSSGGNPISLNAVTTDGAGGVESLVVNAGAGVITMNGAIGASNAPQNVELISSAAGPLALRNINAGTTVTLRLTNGAEQTTHGSRIIAGTLLLEGGPYTLTNASNDVNALGTTGTNVTGTVSFTDTDDFTLNAYSSSSGDLTLSHGGKLTLGGNVTLSNGAFSASGSGGMEISGGTRTINTSGSGGNITISSDLTLLSDLTLNAGATGGTIDLGNVIDTGTNNTLDMTANAFLAFNVTTTLDTLNLHTGNTAGMTVTGTLNANNLLLETTSTNAGANLIVNATLSAQSVTLISEHQVEIQQNITVSGGTAKLRIFAESVNQTGGVLNVPNLELESKAGTNGDFVLDETGNRIGTVTTTGNNVRGDLTLVADGAATPVTINGIVTVDAGSGANLSINHGANTLAINGTNTLAGSFSESGGGQVTLGGSLSVGAGFDISFASALRVSGNASLTVSGAGGDISLVAVNGTTADTDNLTLNLGTGTLTLGDALGGSTAFNNVTINLGNASQLTLANSITASGTLILNLAGGANQTGGVLTVGTLDLRRNGGTGNWSFGQANAVSNLVANNGGGVAGDISITNTASTLTLGNIDTSLAAAGGALTVTHGGQTLQINGTLTLDGAFSQTGGGVTVTGTSTINTSANGSMIDFNSTVTLNNTLTLNAGTGAGGGTVELANVSDQTAGTNTLNVTGRTFNFTGTVGQGNKLGTLNVTANEAAVVTVNGTLNADTVTIANNGGALTTSAAINGQDVTLTATGALLTVNGAVTTSGGANRVTLSGAGAGQGAGGEISTGNLRVGGTGTFALNDPQNSIGTLTTTNNTIDDLQLTSAAATTTLGNINTTGAAGAGDVTVNFGANALSITGTINLKGSFSTGTSTGSITINGGSLTVGANLAFGGTLNVGASGGTLTSGAAGSVSLATVSGAGNALTVNAGSGGIALSNNITLATLTLSTTGSATQSGGTITVTTLILGSSGTYGTPGTALNTTAANIETSGASVAGISISNTGTLNITANNLVSTGDIVLRTVGATADLTLTGNVTAGGANTILLNLGRDVTGSGTITAQNLALVGGRNFGTSGTPLNLAVSNVASDAAGAGREFGLSDNNSLTVGSFTFNTITYTGLTANNGIALTAADDLILSNNVTATGSTVGLIWGTNAGDLLSGAGVITATTLNLQGQNAANTLTLSLNNVTNIGTTGAGITGAAGSNIVDLTSTGAVNFATFMASNSSVCVNSAGVTGGTITAAQLGVTSSANVNVTTALGTVGIDATGGASIAITNTGNLVIGTTACGESGLSTTGGAGITINNTGDITQTGGAGNEITTTGTLTLTGDGNFNLDNTGNTIGTLTSGAGSVNNGPVNIVVTGNINVGNFTTTGAPGDLTVTAGGGGTVNVTGTLNLTGTFSTGGGGGVTISGAQSAPSFNFSGLVTITGNTTFTTTGNGAAADINLGGGVAASGGNWTLGLDNTSSTNAGAVITIGGGMGTSGTALGSITINSNNAITLNQNFTSTGTLSVTSDAGVTVSSGTYNVNTFDVDATGTIALSGGTITATTSVFLTSDANGTAVNQTGGEINTAQLVLTGNGTGTFTLNSAANTVGGLSGSADGTVSLTSDGIVNVGPFNNGANTVNLNVAGATAADVLTAGTLNITSSNSVTLSTTITTLTANLAAGTLTINETNGLTVGAGNVVAPGGVELNTGDTVTLTGNITASNAGALVNLNVGGGTVSGGGTITSTDLQLNGAATSYTVNTVVSNVGGLVTGGGTVTVNNGANAISVADLNVAGGTVNLTANGIGGGTLTAGTANLTSTAGVNVQTTVGNLAISSTGGAVTIFNPIGGLNVAGGGITSGGNTVSITTGGATGVNAGINSGGANIAINAGGLLTFTANVNAGAGTITLDASAGMNQTGGAFTAGTLDIGGTGNATLTQAGNNVATFTGGMDGDVTYTDTNALALGAFDTFGNDLRVNSGGTITLNAVFLDIFGGQLTLNPTAGVTQLAGSSVGANTFLLLGSGNMDLDQGSNTIGTFAANLGGGTSNIDLLVGGNLTVGNVSGTLGVTTAGTSVSIVTTTGTLTIANNITLGGGPGSGTATLIGDVVLGATLAGGGGSAIYLEGQPVAGGGGPITIIIEPFEGAGPPLGPGNLGGGLTDIGGELDELFDLGDLGDMTTELEEDDDEDFEITIKLPEELSDAITTVLDAARKGADDAALRASVEEFKIAEFALTLAIQALEKANKLVKETKDPALVALLKKLMKEVEGDAKDVATATGNVAEKMKALYGARPMDRVGEDALAGALLNLRSANDKLLVAARALEATIQALAKTDAEKVVAVETLTQLIAETKERVAREAQDARDRRDRMSEDEKFASLSEYKFEEKKDEGAKPEGTEPKTESAPAVPAP